LIDLLIKWPYFCNRSFDPHHVWF